jgi:hypothetical protein
MQFKTVIFSAIASLAIFSSSANANIVIFSPTFTGEDICSKVNGAWVGEGTVTAKVLGVKIKCEYNGNAFITGTADPHTFSADINLHLTNGICPPSESFIMPGSCNPATGAINIQSDEANLSGTLSNNGTEAHLTGTVKIPGIGNATVEKMDLHKV